MRENLMLARPYISRRHLLTGATALAAYAALGTREARAADCVWNINDQAGGFGFSNGDLTLTDPIGARSTQIHVFDRTNNAYYTFKNSTQKWNGQAVGSCNPDGNVGGYDTSSVPGTSGTLLGAVGGYSSTPTGTIMPSATGSSRDISLSSIALATLTGFSNINTITGGSQTLDPGQLGSGMSLSGGNLSWSKSGGSNWAHAKMTAGVSSGKMYFACYDNGSIPQAGFVLSTAGNVDNILHSTSGIGIRTDNGHVLRNSSSIEFLGSIQDAFTNGGFVCRATLGRSYASVKHFYELTLTNLDTSLLNNQSFGFANGTRPLYHDTASSLIGGLDGVAQLIGASPGLVFDINVSTSSAVTAGCTALVVLDGTNNKFWVYTSNSGKYNGDVIGAQNPVGNVGGHSTSGMSGTIYPALGRNHGDTAGNINATANFGASAAVNTTQVNALLGAGFLWWDGTGSVVPRQRAYIIQ